MNPNDDMYSLIAWLGEQRDKSRDIQSCLIDGSTVFKEFDIRINCYNEVISHIQQQQVNQRPHINHKV